MENHSSKHSRERRRKGKRAGRKMGGKSKRKVEEEKVVECEKQRQVLLPPSSNPPASFNSKYHRHCDRQLTLTFALSRAKAAAFVSGGRPLVERRGLCIALAPGDFAVNVIGQIPQEADTVLHQLQEERTTT